MILLGLLLITHSGVEHQICEGNLVIQAVAVFSLDEMSIEGFKANESGPLGIAGIGCSVDQVNTVTRTGLLAKVNFALASSRRFAESLDQ